MRCLAEGARVKQGANVGSSKIASVGLNLDGEVALALSDLVFKAILEDEDRRRRAGTRQLEGRLSRRVDGDREGLCATPRAVG